MSSFKFSIDPLRTSDDDVLSAPDDGEQSNPIVASIDPRVFRLGHIEASVLTDLVEKLSLSVEEGALSDDDVLYAFQFHHYGLTKLMLTVATSNR
jgi:hypothetical protein